MLMKGRVRERERERERSNVYVVAECSVLFLSSNVVLIKLCRLES